MSYKELMERFDKEGSVLGSEIYQLEYFPYWHNKKITKNIFHLLTDLKVFTAYNFATLDNIKGGLTNQQVDIVDFLQGNLEYADVYDVDIHVLHWDDEAVVFNYLIKLWNDKYNDGKMKDDDNFYDYIFYQMAREEFRGRITVVDWEGIGHTLPLSNRARLCLNSPRGIGKSVITQNLTPWIGVLDPESATIVGAADSTRAVNFNKQVRSMIERGDVLQHLKPKKGDTDSSIMFNFGIRNPQDSPSFKAVGLMSKAMTGSRGSTIVFDDVEVPNNVVTERSREDLSERVKEAAAVLKTKDIGDVRRIIYLGTPQTEDTLYRKLPERGYTLRVFTARIPSEEQFNVMKGTLCPKIAKHFLDNPQDRTGYGQFKDRGIAIDERMNERELIEKEMEYKKTGFDQQFMLDPSGRDRGKYPLKLSDLLVADLDTEKAFSGWYYSSDEKHRIKDLENVGFTGDMFLRGLNDGGERYKYESTIMAIDPSGKGKDETSYVVLKALHGFMFLVDVGGYQDGYSDDTLQNLVSTAKKYNVDKIILEENFSGGMYEKLLVPFLNKAKCDAGIELVWHSKQKELRIVETLEPVIRQHRLIVDKNVILRDLLKTPDWLEDEVDKRSYMLFYQFTRITKEKGSLKHDDRLDALAMAVNSYSSMIGLDTEVEKRDTDEAVSQMILEHGLAACIKGGKLVSSIEEISGNSTGIYGNLIR